MKIGSEWSGYQIEHVPTYYVADNGELRPYENHGIPGDELLCKYNDVKTALSTPNFNDEFFALRDALRDWPKLPPGHVLKWLHFRYPDDWERGVTMQRELGSEAIPFKTECEGGAGMWDRITQGAWSEP